LKINRTSTTPHEREAENQKLAVAALHWHTSVHFSSDGDFGTGDYCGMSAVALMHDCRLLGHCDLDGFDKPSGLGSNIAGRSRACARLCIFFLKIIISSYLRAAHAAWVAYCETTGDGVGVDGAGPVGAGQQPKIRGGGQRRSEKASNAYYDWEQLIFKHGLHQIGPQAVTV
jgi:hypothetical protein